MDDLDGLVGISEDNGMYETVMDELRDKQYKTALNVIGDDHFNILNETNAKRMKLLMEIFGSNLNNDSITQLEIESNKLAKYVLRNEIKLQVKGNKLDIFYGPLNVSACSTHEKKIIKLCLTAILCEKIKMNTFIVVHDLDVLDDTNSVKARDLLNDLKPKFKTCIIITNETLMMNNCDTKYN